MLTHLFTLIWNKKRAHALLIVEIWASFLVLFGLCTLLIYNVRNYRQPLGFTYQQVWAISLNNNQDTAATAQKVKAIFSRLKAYPEIESVSRMGDNIPFSSYYNGSGIDYGKVIVQVAFYKTDEHFAQTLRMPVIAGRWYRAADSVGKYPPVVINQKARKELFGDDDPIGKIVADKKIVGVVSTFKGKGEFMADEPTLFELLDDNMYWEKTMLIRVKPGTDALFEAKLVKDLTASVKGWSVDVSYLADGRRTQHNETLIPVTIFFIISLFLLINVALGLFGVLNVSVSRRRGEIGLRRALGATEGAVSWQFVGEMWVLATFALVIGLLVAGQFPLLSVFDLDASIYLLAMLLSVLIIYLLVTLCALYPSRRAATVQPAVALHEE